MEEEFSKWAKWLERDQLSRLKWPGVYVLAISGRDISGEVFEWFEDITYIGMTNAQGGLKGRLQQFDRTIGGKEGHGGACRFCHKHGDYKVLVRKLYVCVKPIECDVKSGLAKDFRRMGEVAKLEYDCFAEYVQRFGGLPEFNDKMRSPKR